MGGIGHIGHVSASSLLLEAQSGLPSAPGFGLALLKMVAALVLVCVLAYLVLRLVRRHLPAARGGGLLRVIERCPLSARHSLWIVAVGERYFLLGASDGGISRLVELEREAVERGSGAIAGKRAPRRFRDLLRGGPG